MDNDTLVDVITKDIGTQFKTFGGGQGSTSNPIAEAWKNEALSFAAGVDVSEVVRHIIEQLQY